MWWYTKYSLLLDYPSSWFVYLPNISTKAGCDTRSVFFGVFFFLMRCPHACIWTKDKNCSPHSHCHAGINITRSHLSQYNEKRAITCLGSMRPDVFSHLIWGENRYYDLIPVKRPRRYLPDRPTKAGTDTRPFYVGRPYACQGQKKLQSPRPLSLSSILHEIGSDNLYQLSRLHGQLQKIENGRSCDMKRYFFKLITVDLKYVFKRPPY